MIVVMVAMCISDMHKPTYETGHRPASMGSHVMGIETCRFGMERMDISGRILNIFSFVVIESSRNVVFYLASVSIQ